MLIILPSGKIITWEDSSSISIDISDDLPQYYFISKDVCKDISKEDYVYLSQFIESSPKDNGRLRDN